MKRIDLGAIGDPAGPAAGVSWDDLCGPGPWRAVAEILAPGSVPSDIQVRAIRDAGLLASRRNLVVAGPTNSGKSLLAYLGLIQGAVSGRRALLLEPLRAIAQEKFDELGEVTARLEGALGRKVGVAITTGDYRLDEETMQSPPPEGGEIVIATPERIEAILRNPDNDPWVDSFGVVCADEAHLLGDPTRGASLEYVMTSFRTRTAPPRMLLLSATMGDPGSLERWLDPCDSVVSEVRRPPLRREICALEEGEDHREVVREMVRDILRADGNSVLVFVYQTGWAASLAGELTGALGALCGPAGAKGYHSRLSAATKADIRRQFLEGACRCVVSTAALAMGVNLPATHVIVRDLCYGPGTPVGIGALVQMAGRAGRGSREGRAIFVLKGRDGRTAEELRSELEAHRIPEIRSVLVGARAAGGRMRGEASEEPPLAETLLSLLGRKAETGMTRDEIDAFLGATLAGAGARDAVPGALSWLSGGTRVLAHEADGVWKPTRLGQAAIRGSLPLSTAAGVAQLVRDLLSIEEGDELLHRLTGLDILVLIELMAKRSVVRKSFGEALVGQIDGWMTASQVKSALFTDWLRGSTGHSKAEQVLGSLGVPINGRANAGEEKARQMGYLACFRAIILWQRAHGVLAQDVERRWGIDDLEEIEEPWRDDRLFLLGALLPVWDVKCFFYHLKEDCQANPERVQKVSRLLQRLRVLNQQVLDLISWCSPLGPIFVRMRRAQAGGKGPSPARATMRRLEEAGIRSVEALRALTLEQFRGLGIRKDLAGAIVAFVRRSG